MVIDTSSLKEQSTEKALKFRQNFERARKDAQRLTVVGAKRMDALIKDLNKEVEERLKRFSPVDPSAPFNVRVIPAINAEINNALGQFSTTAKAEVQELMQENFEAGTKVTTEGLRQVGIPMTFPGVDTNILSVLSNNTNGILDEMGNKLQNRINQQMRFSALGLQSSTQAMANVRSLLRTSSEFRGGLRKRIGIAHQAEQIVRTEVGRAYTTAQQFAGEQIAETIPGLKKSWVTSLRKRRGHKDVEDKYKEGGSIGPIPIKDRFAVKDFSRTGTTSFLTLGKRIRPPGFTGGQRVINVPSYSRSGKVITDRMLYPLDPAGSPGNVVNCTCLTIEVIPDFEEAQMRIGGQGEEIITLSPEEQIRNREDGIRWDTDQEHAIAFNQSGQEIFRKSGSKSEVAFNNKELLAMKDSIVTHNHPSGNSFSYDDISLTLQRDLKEIRAVTGRTIHSLKRPKAGWPDAETVVRRAVIIEEEVRSELYEQIRLGNITPKQAGKVHFHELWTRVNKEHNIGYKRKRR